MDFVLKLHGEWRWLVMLAGAIAAVKFGIGWLRGVQFKGMDRGLMAAFTGLLDLNLVLGLILLFGLEGGLVRFRVEHAATMALAVAVAHLSAIWRRSDDSAEKFRNNLILIIAAAVLIAIGVTRLRGGWVF